MKDSNDGKNLSNELKSLQQRIIDLEKLLADQELELDKSQLMIQLLDSATDSIFLHDFDGNFVYVNEAAYKTRGYTKEELMRMNLHDLDVPQYEKFIEPRIEDLMEKEESIFETAHFCKDGSQMPVEIHSKIIEYENKPLVLSCVLDITERKKIENDLIFSKEQYRTLFDSIGVGIAFISPNMEIWDLNNQMKEWFPNIDVSKKPICYKAFNDPPRENICTYCPTYKTLEDGEVHESTTDTPIGDEIINFRIVSSPIKDDEGNVVAAIEMVEDITARKRTEEELKRAYATFNSIFEGPENIIAFSLDRNYQYIFFNQAHSQTMKNIWGMDIEIGESILDYISYPEDREKAKINFDRALSGENFIELEDYGDETISRRYWENIYNPIQSGDDTIGLTVFCIDITERQKADENLKQSEEKFRAVAESAIDAIITADSKGIINFFNRSLLELFGYSASELSGKPVSILIPPEHKNDHVKGMKSFKSGEMHRTGKTSMAVGLKKDGTEFPCEMSISSWKSGEDTYFTSIIRDLTERQKVEEALIESEEKFRLIFNNANDMISLNLMNEEGMPGKFLEVNDVASDRLGYSRDEFLNMSPPDIVTPEKRVEMPGNAELLLEKGSNTFEIVHLTKEGRRIPVEVNNHLITYKGREVCLAISRDITDRKKAEEALRKSEEKYRAIFENVQDVFFQTDIKGKIIEVSPSVEKQFGIRPNELIGNHVDMLYANPEDRKKLLKVLQEKGEVSDYEIELMNSANQLLYLSANVHFIYDSKNRPIGIEGALRDITDRKLAENALKNSEAEYRAIFENSKSAVAVYNAVNNGSNFIFKDFNKAAERIEKLKRKDVIGRKVTEVFPGVVEFGLFDILQRVLRTGKPERPPVSIYKDERIWGWRENYVYKLPSGDIVVVYDDLTEIKQYEEELEKNQSRLKSLVRILQYRAESVKEFLDYALEEAIQLTESKVGYIAHYYDDKKIFALNTWSSEVMDDCSISPLPTRFNVDETGIWGEPVRQRKPIILNDFQTPHPLKRGYPEGHSTLYKFMTIPVFSGDKIVAVVAVANKETDYTETDVLQLELLMDAVWKVMDRQKAEEELNLSRIRLSNAMDLAHLANWELDPYKQMFIFNDKFYSMLGTTAENEGGYSMPIEYYIKEYVHPEDAQFLAEGMKKSLAVRKPTFGTEFEHRIIKRDGEIRFVAIRIRVIPSTETQRARIYGTVQDITVRKIAEEKLKESLEEKEMLLKEIHHRVKNNLMVISSLLNLQSQYIKDKEALDIFKESQNRARSMALIHERLYRSTDLKRIDFGDYIRTLANDLFHTYVTDPGKVRLNMNVENLMVDINTTVPLGLIVNELLTNSMKHGFTDGREGEIRIDFHKEDETFVLMVGDTGVGFPKDLDFQKTSTLGLQLVNNLTSQLDGKIELNRDNGTEFRITFEEQYK